VSALSFKSIETTPGRHQIGAIHVGTCENTQ
jgi:hypothetical protein